jgi:MFS family permease
VRARGQITSLHQLSLTIGNLFVGLLGYYLVTRVPSGWRWLNAFMIVPPVLQCLLVAWIPESPWWLMKNYGREEVGLSGAHSFMEPVALTCCC